MRWWTRGCVMTDIDAAAPVAAGRSLWADAWSRLKANKAAKWSGYYLIFMTIICIVGPWLTPHAFSTIYQDYTRVPPSLSSYPKPEMLEQAVKDAVKRSRVDLADWRQEGEKV